MQRQPTNGESYFELCDNTEKRKEQNKKREEETSIIDVEMLTGITLTMDGYVIDIGVCRCKR
jgi:hypothetical protein